MPVSVIVGGQFGSEGKGKVALHFARAREVKVVVRVGGPNSGHTGIDKDGNVRVLRQLPASSLYDGSTIVLPAGSLIDPIILKKEVSELGIGPDRLIIDGKASIVSEYHRSQEFNNNLIKLIGSTGSGTGACLQERISRSSEHLLAEDDSYVKQFTVNSTSQYLRSILDKNLRILIEGTQGFGLSLWHGKDYPYATSRDTTASSFVSEAGLAPHDVDEVVLVLRTFPIRVAGNSGYLPNEIDWPTLSREADLNEGYVELTSATKKIRRVARFDSDVVKQAIAANNPHSIVLNHVDYVDKKVKNGQVTKKAEIFISSIEKSIGRPINFLGISPSGLIQHSHQSAEH